ncbi:MAG: DUF4058 family protein [Planctomycetaceae bacterium]
MPSPFPGMDPFLEAPDVFPDFHDAFIAYLREAIQPTLPVPYYAALGRRAWVEVTERFIGPDVQVLSDAREPRRPGGSQAATLEVTRPVIVKVPHDERVETLVEIYIGRGQEKRLVTAIELLSPSNKTPGEKGRDLYLRKQAELLDSRSHIVEIDLLRGGHHTTAVPEKRKQRFVAPTEYHVCAHRFDQFEDYLIYPIPLRGPLPTVNIPLLPGDDDVSISLQDVFLRTYAAGPYHREIDYSQPVPEPPLPDDVLKWVREQLQARRES